MDYSMQRSDFWDNLRTTALVFPYLQKELDRKYNLLTKIRKLKETDPDLAQSLTGKVCVMTGGTRGIGAEVVKVLLRKDCHVITSTSSKNKADHRKAYDSIRAEVPLGKGKLEIWYMDLKSMDSVVEFTNRLKESELSVNYFIANAGICLHQITKTSDNFEQTLAVNYLSHCLLIDRLIDNLYETSKKSNTESRIVLVSSAAHKCTSIRFKDFMFDNSNLSLAFVYAQSKLALTMFGLKMDRWLKEKGEDWSKNITINSLHPGICNTEILSHMPLMEELRPMSVLAFRSPKEGAETTIYCMLSSQMTGISGKYLEDCAIEEPSFEAQNIDDQNKLWNMTWNLLDKWTEHYWIPSAISQ